MSIRLIALVMVGSRSGFDQLDVLETETSIICRQLDWAILN